MFSSLLFLRYLQGCVNSCHHLLTQTGINCCVLNFSYLILCCCRPVASVYFHLKRNLSNSFSFVDFHSFSVLAVVLQLLRLVCLVITLSVTMLDSCCLMLNMLIICVIVMTSFLGRYLSCLTGYFDCFSCNYCLICYNLFAWFFGSYSCNLW